VVVIRQDSLDYTERQYRSETPFNSLEMVLRRSQSACRQLTPKDVEAVREYAKVRASLRQSFGARAEEFEALGDCLE
jgi:hypothetical protein